MAIKKIFLILILIFCLNVCYSQSFYLSPNGSDLTGNGSYENPWKTFTYGVNNIPDEINTQLILKDGEYNSWNQITKSFNNWITIKAENNYKAKLTNIKNNRGNPALSSYDVGDVKVIIEGFEITNQYGSRQCGNRESQYLIHFQSVSDIILRNNIIHGNNAPNTCNELVKINRGSDYFFRNIIIDGNLFFNPADAGGSDMIDSVRVGEIQIMNNIFMGGNSQDDSHSFITLKREVPQSFDEAPSDLMNPRVKIIKNIFLDWEGKADQAFVQLGEDGMSEYDITNALIENNLFYHNSNNRFAAPIQLKGTKNVTIRANTVIGNNVGMAYLLRTGTEGANPQVKNIFIYNNILSDLTGTMGEYYAGNRLINKYGDVDMSTVFLDNNLFWNNENELPLDSDLDSSKVISQFTYSDINLPIWNNKFSSGNENIREEFERIVNEFELDKNLNIVDNANKSNMPKDDILGNLRDEKPDIGALEINSQIFHENHENINENGQVNNTIEENKEEIDENQGNENQDEENEEIEEIEEIDENQEKTTEAIKYCIEEWKCSEWSKCTNEKKSRECNDLNNCSTKSNKPRTSLYCSISQEENKLILKEDLTNLNETLNLTNNTVENKEIENIDNELLEESNIWNKYYYLIILILLTLFMFYGYKKYKIKYLLNYIEKNQNLNNFLAEYKKKKDKTELKYYLRKVNNIKVKIKKKKITSISELKENISKISNGINKL